MGEQNSRRGEKTKEEPRQRQRFCRDVCVAESGARGRKKSVSYTFSLIYYYRNLNNLYQLEITPILTSLETFLRDSFTTIKRNCVFK